MCRPGRWRRHPLRRSPVPPSSPRRLICCRKVRRYSDERSIEVSTSILSPREAGRRNLTRISYTTSLRSGLATSVHRDAERFEKLASAAFKIAKIVGVINDALRIRIFQVNAEFQYMIFGLHGCGFYPISPCSGGLTAVIRISNIELQQFELRLSSVLAAGNTEISENRLSSAVVRKLDVTPGALRLYRNFEVRIKWI